MGDVPYPAKGIVVPERTEARRRELINNPSEALDLLTWIGWSMEDVWNYKVSIQERHWTSYNAALIYWMITGNMPDISNPNRIMMKDVLMWWSQAPDTWRKLLDPLVTQWKVYAYYDDAFWETRYDEGIATRLG